MVPRSSGTLALRTAYLRIVPSALNPRSSCPGACGPSGHGTVDLVYIVCSILDGWKVLGRKKPKVSFAEWQKRKFEILVACLSALELVNLPTMEDLLRLRFYSVCDMERPTVRAAQQCPE